MKPLIGVTMAFDEKFLILNKWYFRAILAAGAYPFAICSESGELEGYTDAILDKVDGLIFSGGGDIHAKYFNEELSPKATRVLEERDIFELMLCRKALKKDLPVLGICRGIQLLNVAAGGNIEQHLETHPRNESRHETLHNVNIAENTKLFEIFKTGSIAVNSLHHQAVGRIPEGVIAAAKAEDGVIEAIEMPGKKFTLAVQWHPEALIENYPWQLNIFKSFIQACV